MTRLSLLICLALFACQETPKPVGLANPASVYCADQGGTSVSRETAQGTVSDCHLPDGRIIEEWALFRADHPQ